MGREERGGKGRERRWEGDGGEQEKGKGKRSVPANKNLQLHPCLPLVLSCFQICLCQIITNKNPK